LEEQEIVIGTVGEARQEVLLSTVELGQFLPETNSRSRLLIAYVAPHPQNSDLLFITVIERTPEDRLHVFALDRRSSLPEHRLQTVFDIYHSLSFSPDGRYLLLTGRESWSTSRSDPTAILLLHDIEENKTTPFLSRQPAFISSQAYDWSADGQWLSFVLADNMVAIVAPEAHDARPLLHNAGECTSVVWLNE
jgi:hypothetical protein